MKDGRPQLPLTDDRSWSIADVAYFLNLSKSTVRNLERSGQLPSLPRIGRRVTFDPVAVRAFRDGSRPPTLRPARATQVLLSSAIQLEPS
jgi:predicted DNA-binding transcriptional regulator AlpA